MSSIPREALNEPDFRQRIFDFDFADLINLNSIMTRLRASPLVSKVERMIG